MDEIKSKKDVETMIAQFNGGVSKFFFLKNMFGYCGCSGCKEKKQGKTGKDIKFNTKHEKNMAIYLSGFCVDHSVMVKENLDTITSICS